MITTKRLFLIPWHASDADELYELAKDPEIGPLCGWEPHKTLEDSKQVLANVLSDKSCYAVKDMKTGHVIGSMSLNFEEISDLKDPSKQLHQAEIPRVLERNSSELPNTERDQLNGEDELKRTG